MNIGNPVHEFVRVRGGSKLYLDIHLRTSITIDGKVYNVVTQLFPETLDGLEVLLDIAEESLGRAVGRKIVSGIDL